MGAQPMGAMRSVERVARPIHVGQRLRRSTRDVAAAGCRPIRSLGRLAESFSNTSVSGPTGRNYPERPLFQVSEFFLPTEPAVALDSGHVAITESQMPQTWNSTDVPGLGLPISRLKVCTFTRHT